MVTKVADRAVLDTNVLLAASDRGRPEFGRAQEALNEWPAAGTALYTSGQILREYLCVATRATHRNGLGMSQTDALGNVTSLRGRLRLLAEDEKVSLRLCDLLGEIDCGGKQVHDANIVATMLVHGVEAMVTMNTSDFDRFRGLVSVHSL